ncbi:hypothetical protein [Treponema socranskii]|nr:hypothetical protein [Treponema socranskii]
MKKAIFAAAAVFFGFVFLSCSDVFGGRETDGIAFTVPPLAPQSALSHARAAAGGAEGPWSIYGFLFGEDADPVEIKNIGNGQFTPPSAGEAQGYKGLIQAVSRKGVDISRPQPLFFQRVQAKTKCFVCVLVTYTTSAKMEHTVFSGISPESLVNWAGANYYFTDNFYTPDTGENDISLTLKRNESAPVYFATQNGVGVINSYGQSTYSPQQSTPYKPTHFYWSHGGDRTGALRAVQDLPPDEAGVIILMDDVDVSGISALPSISTSDNRVKHSVDFDSISGKRCKIKANEFSVSSDRYLSFRNILIAADTNSVKINEKGELRFGGAVSLGAGTEINFTNSSLAVEIGRIIVTSPLFGEVGKVSVSFADPATKDDMKDYVKTHPLVRDDTGSTDVPACFGSAVTVTSVASSLSFTARWKRVGGNSWVLEARD